MEESLEALQKDNEQLRQRVAELEQERDAANARCQWIEDLLEQSDIPVCLWQGDDLVYTFANQAYLRRTGKGDAVGKPLRAVFDEREIPGLLRLVEQAYTSGERQVIPEAMVNLGHAETGQRETSWHNLIHNPVRNAQGEVIGVSLFAVEVTEQVRARQRLLLQAQMLDQTPGSIIVTDMQGTIISWNQASTTIYGYTADEVVGQSIASLYPPDEREHLSNDIIAPLQEHGKLEMETTTYTKSGDYIPLQLTLSLLRDEAGIPIGMIGYSLDITERKKQEATLYNQMELFANLLDTLPFPVFYKDAQGIYRGCNRVFAEEFMGKTIDDIVNKGLHDLLPTEQATFYKKVDDALLEQGGLQIYERDVTFADTTCHTVLFHKSVYANPDGTPGGIIGAMIDITDRKQQEEELRIFKALADSSPDAIGIAMPNGIVTYANPAFQDMFGYGDDTIGMIHMTLFTEEDQRERIPLLLESVTSTGSWSGFLTGQHKDGSTFPVQISPFAIWGSNGELQALPAIIRDITDMQQREEQLRTFQSVVENSPDGVSIVSPDGIITYGNPAMQALVGYGDEYVGLPVPVVFGGDSDTPMQIINYVIEHGSWTGTQQYYHKDGSTLPVHVSVFAIRNTKGEVLSFPGIVRDMTDVRQAEAERAALQQQIIDAQRAALRELSAPLLPISQHTVVLPLVGTIDSQRAQQIMETLLEGVARHHAETAIVDITGVQVVDTQVANALIQTAQAVRLLGAQVVLTGIGPTMAQTLVGLGVDLSSIETRGTLQAGIAHVLNVV